MPDEPRRGRHPALAHREFRLYLIGQSLSQLGTKMQNAALLWHLFTLTHSARALGAIGGARLAPIVLFGLAGGVIADSVDRRRLLIQCQAAQAALAAGLALWSFYGLPGPWPIYLVTAVSGIVSAFEAPTRQSFLPGTVPPEDLVSAIGLDSLAQKLAKVFAPALMTGLLVTSGPAAVYLLNAASYFAVIGALLCMSSRGSTRPVRARGAWGEVVDGIRYVRSSRVLGPLLALDFTANFFGACDSMLPLMASQVLNLGPWGYGVLASAAPIGAVAGAIIAGMSRSVAALPAQAARATAIFGLATACFGASRHPVVTFVALAFAAGADTVATVLRNTFRHATTPDHLRGRVASLNTLIVKSGPALGEVEAGFVADWVGVGPSIVLGGLLCMAGVGVFSRSMPGTDRAVPGDH